jgi:hypothetical protein
VTRVNITRVFHQYKHTPSSDTLQGRESDRVRELCVVLSEDGVVQYVRSRRRQAQVLFTASHLILHQAQSLLSNHLTRSTGHVGESKVCLVLEKKVVHSSSCVQNFRVGSSIIEGD